MLTINESIGPIQYYILHVMSDLNVYFNNNSNQIHTQFFLDELCHFSFLKFVPFTEHNSNGFYGSSVSNCVTNFDVLQLWRVNIALFILKTN